jgi:hypothetical protein
MSGKLSLEEAVKTLLFACPMRQNQKPCLFSKETARMKYLLNNQGIYFSGARAGEGYERTGGTVGRLLCHRFGGKQNSPPTFRLPKNPSLPHRFP